MNPVLMVDISTDETTKELPCRVEKTPLFA